MPSTSTKKRRLSSGFGVRSSACAILATSCSGSVIARRARAGRRGHRRARLPRASRASRARARHARVPLASTSVDALPLDDDGPVRVEHDDVALPDRRASDLNGLADRAGNALLRAGDAHVARPDRQAHLAQLLDVAHGCVDEDRGDAAPLRLRRRAARRRAPPGAGSGIVSTSTSPGSASATAACTMRLSSWPQRTVRAGPAAREPGRIWINGRSTTGARPAASWTVALPSCASSAKTSVTARSRPAASRAGTPRRTGSRSRPTSAARGCRAARRAACST